MNSLATIKDQTIREYLSNVDFRDDFSLKKIKQDLHRLLGEMPAIKLEYAKEKLFSERLGEQPRIVETVKSIVVTFSDGEEDKGMPIVQHVTYFV